MTNSLTIPLYKTIDGAVEAPCLHIYLPKEEQKPAKAVIICGGGGFNIVSLEHEGHQFAQWLASIGVAGIVLHYRLPAGDKKIPEMDLRRAISIVRAYAADWNIDENAIGAAGFSIGGHTVSFVAVNQEEETKLDFTLLFYPVISMSDALTHKPSRERLLGNQPSAEDIMQYSSEEHVSATTPKCLIMTTDDDMAVSPLNSVVYYEKLKQYGIPASLHIFANGGHAWGVKKDFPYHKEMLSIIESWLA